MDLLTPPVRPIVAANGGELDLLGQVQFPVFIARDLTQECLLGADFLKQHDCVINMIEQTLVAGGKQVVYQPNQLLPCVMFLFLQIQ